MLYRKSERKRYIKTLVISLLLFNFPCIAAFSQESATKDFVSSVTQESRSTPFPKEPDPQEWIEFIQQKRALLAREIEGTVKSRGVDSATGIEDHIATQNRLLESLDSIYSQQMAAIEQQIALQTQRKRYQDEIQKIEALPDSESDSYVELDRLQEDLYVEQKRGETLDTKMLRAESSQAQAKKTLGEKERVIDTLKDTQSVKETDALDPSASYPLFLAQTEVRLASETLRLRDMELHAERLAKETYDTHISLLTRRIEQLKNHVKFTHDDLEEQLQRIRKEEYDINRELTRANDLLNTAKSRLTKARDLLTQATPEEQKAVDAEIEARRLEAESIQTRIDNLAKYLEMLEGWKEAWQRRYSVFNFDVQNQNLDEWKNETRTRLDLLSKEERLQMLLLSDWQNRLLTLTNKLANLDVKTDSTAKYIDLQQKAIQRIVETQQTYQTRIENTRRWYTKLLNEIEDQTSQIGLRERINIFLNKEFNQNTLRQWLYALVCAFGIVISLSFVRWTLVSRLNRYAEEGNQSFARGFAISVRRTSQLFLLILAIYFSSQLLTLPVKTRSVIVTLAKVGFVVQSAYWISFFIRTWIYRYLARKMRRDEASLGALSIFNFISQLVIWSLAILLTLQNIGIDVTALVAGLGVGGVAVALALQNILGDLFSSLSIVLDRPFVIGDFIIFDNFNYLGTVEHIGIKTTRIRSLTGEQIVCSNSDLLNTRIRNFKRMRERRVVFQIGVVYQTSYEQLKRIPQILKQSVIQQENTRFDRAHFFKYADFSLIFEIVYYVSDPDYNKYMDIQQAINLYLFKRFEEEGIEFAYPTQTLYLQNKFWEQKA